MSESEPDRSPIWQPLSERTLLSTPYYDITCDSLRHPRGHELDYYVVRPHRAAVGIVPVGDDGRVLLVRQWRHTVQKLLWAIPAGAIDPGEDPPAAAARELREETGHAAAHVLPLYNYHPTAGTSSQTFHLFLGRSITRIGEHDAQEIDAIAWHTREQLEQMIDANDLLDGMSLPALLLWLRTK